MLNNYSNNYSGRLLRYIIAALCLIFITITCKNDHPNYEFEVVANPYEIAPLTALISLETNKACSVSYMVQGIDPIGQQFKEQKLSHKIPILGLYPDTLNEILLTISFEDEIKKETIKIKTQKLQDKFPDIKIDKLDRDRMITGLHACDIHYANHGKFNSIPMIFDDKGIIRWYLDLSFNGKMIGPFQRLKNGNIGVVARHTIFEFDMLGKELNRINLDQNYGMHHDLVEMPNGDFLLPVGKRDAFINLDGEKVWSDSDCLILFDRNSSKIIKEWDVAKYLDVTRNDINVIRKNDWFHMNALVFDERDSSLLISGKNQGLIKVTWEDELSWILAPKQNWGKSGRLSNGPETKPYLLTAIDKNEKPYSSDIQLGVKSASDFDFSWGQHSPSLLKNGNIMVFDNGAIRNYSNGPTYSRAVEYKIDEENKSVQQIWEYGKNRGAEFHSAIVSDVDFLDESDHVLITSGFILTGDTHSGKIVEVDYKTGKEVFEATLFFKSINGNKTISWGQMDILYRSERMALVY